MQRYYFNLSDGFIETDEQGTEFASLAEARIGAVRYAGELLANEPSLLSDGHDLKVRISNDTRDDLFDITVSTTG